MKVIKNLFYTKNALWLFNHAYSSDCNNDDDDDDGYDDDNDI